MSAARVRRIAALVCYGGATIAIAVLASIGLRLSWDFERALFLVRGSGWCAIVLLLLALIATPIGRVLRRFGRGDEPKVAAFRRALGISSAVLATVHGALALTSYLESSIGHALELIWIRAGLLSWSILVVLFVTSFPPLVRAMRVRAWKPLHRLAYVAAFFALQHAIMSPLAPRGWVLLVFAIAIGVGLLRALPVRRRSREPAAE